MKHLACLLLALATVLGLPGPARADGARGQVGLRAERGGPTVELLRDGDVFSGAFVMRNEGPGALSVSRVAVRTSPTDPRTPPGVTVEVEGGRGAIKLDPGAERRVTVRWRGFDARAWELYGQVVVESDGAGVAGEPGKPSAIGIHAERNRGLGPIGAHPLSVLLLLPLLGALLALGARAARRDEGRLLGAASAAMHGLAFALALWIAFRFDRAFTRTDGNDGLQFVERATLLPSLGVEYALGVDGLSIVFVLGTSLAAFVAMLSASREARPRQGLYLALLHLAVAGAYGLLFAQDLFLCVAFALLSLLPLSALTAGWGGPLGRRAGMKLLLAGLVSTALLGAATVWLWQHADPTWLADGTPAPRTALIQELARVAWLQKGEVIFGASAVKVLWIGLFGAFAIRLGAPPFSGFLPSVFAEADAPVAVLVAGAFVPSGACGILRIAMQILPEATRWAAPTLVGLGAATLCLGAFAAMAQSDLKRLVAFGTIAQSGLVLLALGALTPASLQASIAHAVAQGAAASLLLLLCTALSDRVKTRDLGSFGGLFAEMPRFSALYLIGALGVIGLPGLAGFWGPWLGLVGAFPRYRALSVVGGLGLVLVAALHVWALGHLLFGRVRDEWRRSKYLEPFGGKFPELRRGELGAALPLALLVVALGLYPRALLGLCDRGCLDIHRLLDPPGPTQIAEAPRPHAEDALAALGSP